MLLCSKVSSLHLGKKIPATTNDSHTKQVIKPISQMLRGIKVTSCYKNTVHKRYVSQGHKSSIILLPHAPQHKHGRCYVTTVTIYKSSYIASMEN